MSSWVTKMLSWLDKMVSFFVDLCSQSVNFCNGLLPWRFLFYIGVINKVFVEIYFIVFFVE